MQFRMTSVMSRLAVVAGMALGLGLCPVVALAAEPEPYPIWWSPTLELESLDKIDERLRKPFGRGFDEGLPLFTGEGADRVIVGATNCVSLERLLDDGYWGLGHNNHEIGLFFMAQCHALRMLQGAKPAKISYLRNFVMDANSIDYLPAFVNIFGSCHWMCLRYRANEEGIPLGRFEPEFDIEVVSPDIINGRSDYSTLSVEIVARADFNGDDLDDLLVIAGASATEGTWGGTKLFLLGRETNGGFLRVLDAEQHLCSNYQCQEQSE